MRKTRIVRGKDIDPEMALNKRPARTIAEQLDGLALFTGQPIEVPPPKRKVEVRAHMRHVDGPPPLTGEERKEAALQKHEAKDEVREVLAYVREKLRQLYVTRCTFFPEVDQYVTPDDADDILRQWSKMPVSVRDGSQTWRGSLFREKGWQMLPHTVKSKRRNQNATRIAAWIYITPSQDQTDEQ